MGYTMKINELYEIFQQYPVVTTDSRNVPVNAIYFALKGDNFDGNAFAAQALEKGASYAVIDNKDFYSNERTILVEHVLSMLQDLARFHRRKLGIPIIAITGTNGKTTTKELTRSVLAEKYNVLATQGNLNNHIGVPLTLLSMTVNTQVGIIEMGANHPLEIAQLCNIAEPNVGLITNIGKAHLEGFGGFQGVIKTKKELYDFLIANQGKIFYNSDNDLLSGLLETYSGKISYGTHTATLTGTIISSNPFLKVEIKSGKDVIKVNSNLVGGYNLENILAASTVGLNFSVPLSSIKTAIEAYSPSNNRSQLTNTGKNKLLLDCYNANPSSTEAAIINFSGIDEQHKVIILGDMLELGEDSVKEHLHILELLKEQKSTQVFVVGSYYKTLAEPFGYKAFLHVTELCDWLTQHPMEQSFILIKGSRGIQLEKVVSLL